MSDIQENNTHETLNETHNQNIDTQVANEEAPVQTEAPQNNQDIGAQDHSTFGLAEPPAQEEGMNPADATDPAVTMSSEDLVGSDRNRTMSSEDTLGTDTAENTSDFVAGDETNVLIDLEAMDSIGEVFEDETSPTVSEDDRDLLDDGYSNISGGEGSWLGNDIENDNVSPTVSEDGWFGSWDSEPSDTEAVSQDPTPGGYDGSSIVGDLGIDYDNTDDGKESDERSPDVIGEEEDASEAKSDFTDADYQEVLDDLDNGNLDDVREFLEGLGLSEDDTEEAPQHAPGVPDEDGKLVDEGISVEDIVGGEEKVEGGLEEANNGTEEYTYDEEAYEDAQDAMKDLKHALKHGDEEDRAEALENLQGYLGGFDKDDAEDQDGTETRDDQIPSVSENDSDGDGMEDAKDDSDGDGVLDLTDSDDDGDGMEDVIDFDADGNGIDDWEELDSDGDGIKDAKDDSDGDGMLDWLDSDSDGDGIDDWLVSDFDGNGIEYGKEDSDGDGIENAKDDSDGDGLYDWQDSDSDGNGIDDFEEIFDDPYEFTCF